MIAAFVSILRPHLRPHLLPPLALASSLAFAAGFRCPASSLSPLAPVAGSRRWIASWPSSRSSASRSISSCAGPRGRPRSPASSRSGIAIGYLLRRPRRWPGSPAFGFILRRPSTPAHALLLRRPSSLSCAGFRRRLLSLAFAAGLRRLCRSISPPVFVAGFRCRASSLSLLEFATGLRRITAPACNYHHSWELFTYPNGYVVH